MDYKDIKNDVTVTIDGCGIYSIVKFKKGSRSIVVVKDIERGDGWYEPKQKHIGIKYLNKDGKQTGWSRGENYCYGEKLDVKISRLKKINTNSLPELKRIDGHAISVNWKLQYKQ